jgi:hypothetical protein
MTYINFNTLGLARPSTQAETLSLLDEALRLADELDSQIECMAVALAEQAVEAHV